MDNEFLIPDIGPEVAYSDAQLLDWLQKQLDKKQYTGKIIFRWSGYGRGIRLHETTLPGSVNNVREAIVNAILKEQEDEKED